MNVIFPKPSNQADKAGVYLQNIRADALPLLLKFKSGLFRLIRKNSVGVMAPLSRMIIQHKNRLVRGRAGISCGGTDYDGCDGDWTQEGLFFQIGLCYNRRIQQGQGANPGEEQ